MGNGGSQPKENSHAAHIREKRMATARRMLAGNGPAAIATLVAKPNDGSAAVNYSVVVSNLAASFRALAGSQENARALVEALHEGRRVRLVGPVSYTHLRAHETPEH